MTPYKHAEAALDALARHPIDNTPPRAGRRLRAFLDTRGAPDAAMQVVIIAGTVGKGSTAACLASMLRACGEKVGLFTGPHLSRWTERIRIDGRAIGELEWARRVEELLAFAARLDERPSVLEVLAVLALEWFQSRGVRWAIMEAGVGGTRDYTFGLNPELSVLTRVDLDHRHLLGETIAEIAEEKCGIIREGESIIVASQTEEARAVIEGRAIRAGAPLWLAERDFTVSHVRTDEHGTSFDFFCAPLGVRWLNLRVALAGEHQAENAGVAVAAALRIWVHGRTLLSAAHVRSGLRSVRVGARLERMDDVVLDGAHQPAGARALRQALDTVYAGRPIFLVLGVLDDKDRDGIAEPLVDRAHAAWFTRPPWKERAGDDGALEAWAARWSASADPSWREAVTEARAAAAEVDDGLVVVTGSLYLVGAAREWLTA